MPFAGFEDFSSCVATMEEDGHDIDSAENICGALQAEAKSDHGNVEELMAALDRGAGLIADVGVDLVSGVDVPAVDSKWVMTKSGGARKGHDFRAASPVLLSKDDDADQRISYAAAMIPREPDKEGDVVATPTVENAAHDFLKSDGGVDTDHSLIDGEGEVVESWVLKEERTFDLPGGETETYGAGTWMVGIEWGTDAWERIQNGDLTGLSIYGMAEHVSLGKAATGATPNNAGQESNEQNSTMSDSDLESLENRLDEIDSAVTTVKETTEELKETVESDKDGGGDGGGALLDQFAEQIAEQRDDIEMSVPDIKAKIQAALNGENVEEADAFSVGKEADQDAVVDVLAGLNEVEAGADTIANTVGPLFNADGGGGGGDGGGGGGEDEDDEDEETEASAKTSKGYGTGGGSAATAKDAASEAGGGVPSYRAVAENGGD